MKKIFDTVLAVLLIGLVLWAGWLLLRVDKINNQVIESAYADIEKNAIREAENQETIAALLRESFWYEQKARDIEKRYLKIVSGLNDKIEEYRDKQFKDLTDCQINYNKVFSDLELCLFKHGEAWKILVNEKKSRKELSEAFDLLDKNYDSCLDRVELYKKIIDEKDKVSRWGWYIGAGPYIGYSKDGGSWGACLNLSYGRKIK
jgi:hypothetical protein